MRTCRHQNLIAESVIFLYAKSCGGCHDAGADSNSGECLPISVGVPEGECLRKALWLCLLWECECVVLMKENNYNSHVARGNP